MPKKGFYITTPIYYVNDIPHIGHTSTTVMADIIARYHRLIGDQVFFLTGTDEHGAKIAQAAAKKGLSPKEFCDQIAPRFQETWKRLNISNDFFIRTTDPRHEKLVQEFLEKIYQKGDIYKSTYRGLYCVGCEKFLTETDLVNNHCPIHPPEQTVQQEEENWFFKLSKYLPKIIELVEDKKTNYIFPEGKRQEVLSKLKMTIPDLSISRANVPWGIPIPWDNSQTIYVWFDALINYYSATQFLLDKNKFWPADLHLLAKEILWFHTVIWQAMLLATNLPLPKKTFIHSFYVMNDQKMSKSLGNLISPDELIERFGVDATRYLIASSIPVENDTNVSLTRFITKYNADLANGLGNLVSRTAKLWQNQDYLTVRPKESFISGVKEAIDSCNLPLAVDLIWNDSKEGVSAINKKLNQKEVWTLRGKTLEKELKEIVTDILNLAYNITPFMPQTAQKTETIFLRQSNLEQLLFPRV